MPSFELLFYFTVKCPWCISKMHFFAFIFLSTKIPILAVFQKTKACLTKNIIISRENELATKKIARHFSRSKLFFSPPVLTSFLWSKANGGMSTTLLGRF